MTGLCQFIRHRFLGHQFMRAIGLALVIALYLWLPDRRIMGRFHERIAKILITILSIAFSFLFAIAELVAGYTACTRCIVIDRGEAFNRVIFWPPFARHLLALAIVFPVRPTPKNGTSAWKIVCWVTGRVDGGGSVAGQGASGRSDGGGRAQEGDETPGLSP